MKTLMVRGVEVVSRSSTGDEDVLTPEALEFLAALHRFAEPQRRQLLLERAQRQARLDAGERPAFLAPSARVKDESWKVPEAPKDLQRRWVEITGPTDAKMMINALNSGADVYMADFEDANTPTWTNLLEGQRNLTAAIERRLAFESPEGKGYRLNARTATLVVRPRGWHLDEKHLKVDGHPMAGALFDFGLYVFQNHARLHKRGTGPYFYLPKLENHHEARLWNEVFNFTEDALKMRRGTIRATVLLETILAAFEVEEILFELREHASGLNAGRWDYIFSLIKKFRNHPEFLLPDRAQVTMTVPFMRSYTNLLVQTCHRRGAHAIGGMAAFIPNRKDPQVSEAALAQVRADKERESGDGFDGTWVAHPDLVPVARKVFEARLGGKPHQLERGRDDVHVSAAALLDVRVPGGRVTRSGVEGNVAVALRYLDSWLKGRGAAAIANLMEDTATAEIARAQLWQWRRHGVRLEDGTLVTESLLRDAIQEQFARAEGELAGTASRLEDARRILERITLDEAFVEFLTHPAYELID